MKAKNIILFIIILLMGTIAVFSLSDDVLSPYVSFNEAKTSGKSVQIIGSRDKNKPVKSTETSFSFSMKDEEGAAMKIMHTGTKPLNFEHAEKIVVIGKYNTIKKQFNADKILVKCPSKYKRKKVK